MQIQAKCQASGSVEKGIRYMRNLTVGAGVSAAAVMVFDTANHCLSLNNWNNSSLCADRVFKIPTLLNLISYIQIASDVSSKDVVCKKLEEYLKCLKDHSENCLRSLKNRSEDGFLFELQMYFILPTLAAATIAYFVFNAVENEVKVRRSKPILPV